MDHVKCVKIIVVSLEIKLIVLLVNMLTCYALLEMYTAVWNYFKTFRRATINAVYSGAILFNGLMDGPVRKLFSSLNIRVPSQRTYYNVQHEYLHGVSGSTLYCQLMQLPSTSL